MTPVVVWLKTNLCDSGCCVTQLNLYDCGCCFVTHSNSVWIRLLRGSSKSMWLRLLWDSRKLCVTPVVDVTHRHFVTPVVVWLSNSVGLQLLCDSGCCGTHNHSLWLTASLCDSQQLCMAPVVVVWLTQLCSSDCRQTFRQSPVASHKTSPYAEHEVSYRPCAVM